MAKYINLLLVSTILLFASCRDTYYRTKTGLLYKVISSPGKDSIARMGNTVKVRYVQRVGDTIIDDIYDKMPLYYMVVPGMSPYNPLEPFDYGLKEGDSVKTIQIVDSMIKKGIFKKMAPWMKKDDEWITTFKVEKVFRSDSLLNIDKEMETKRITELQKSGGIKRIEAFLEGQRIKTAKKAGDTYVEVIQQGSGSKADSGKYVSLQFNVKTIKGKTLNSTTDTSFHQPGPAGMVMGQSGMPPIVESKLMQLQKGGSLRVYVPGVLVFGVMPQSRDVKVDDDIIFDFQLVDVQDKAPAPPPAPVAKAAK